MKTVTAIELRKKLGGILDSVAKNQEPVTITRANRPLAVLVSADEYREKILESERGRKLRALSARMDAWREKHRKETARIDVVRLIREIREK